MKDHVRSAQHVGQRLLLDPVNLVLQPHLVVTSVNIVGPDVLKSRGQKSSGAASRVQN